MSGSGISWAICKSAPRSRQITMPTSHHPVFSWAKCPSCRPINSVKVVNANNKCLNKNDRLWVGPIADAVLIFIFWWLSFADFWLLSLYSFYPAHPGLVLPLIGAITPWTMAPHGTHTLQLWRTSHGDKAKHIWSPSTFATGSYFLLGLIMCVYHSSLFTLRLLSRHASFMRYFKK